MPLIALPDGRLDGRPPWPREGTLTSGEAPHPVVNGQRPRPGSLCRAQRRGGRGLFAGKLGLPRDEPGPGAPAGRRQQGGRLLPDLLHHLARVAT